MNATNLQLKLNHELAGELHKLPMRSESQPGLICVERILYPLLGRLDEDLAGPF